MLVKKKRNYAFSFGSLGVGITGFSGLAGSIGSTGSVGFVGSSGSTGSIGSIGKTGSLGSIGSVGVVLFGWLVASNGLVLASISSLFVNPSLS